MLRWKFFEESERKSLILRSHDLIISLRGSFRLKNFKDIIRIPPFFHLCETKKKRQFYKSVPKEKNEKKIADLITCARVHVHTRVPGLCWWLVLLKINEQKAQRTEIRHSDSREYSGGRIQS